MATAILGLLAETPIHAGASASAGVIDLPIQRESHTGWPVVYGSGVKGSLRASANGVPWETEVFGPDRNSASDHAGALAVGDARLLLLPVRSLTSHFRWVTCPALLRRAAADWARLGLGDVEIKLTEIGPDEVLVPKADTPGKLFLEELSFAEKVGGLDEIVAFVAKFLPKGHDPKGHEVLLQNQLAIVSNDNFAYLAKFATPVTAHVALNNDTKTVERGALWYEETLPPDTLLYTCLLAHRSRKKEGEHDASAILSLVLEHMKSRPYLQLGGNETVGMGWCQVTTVTSETNGKVTI